MDLQPNKTDGVIKPITNTRISASEWNQLVGSCMEFITEAGFTPDAEDNAQFLNAFKAIAANLELIGANTNLSNLTATGENHFAKPDLSNATAPHIVETYHSGTEWYRVWSDGWCEQGGVVSSNDGTDTQVNLHKQYADTNYSVYGLQYGSNGQAQFRNGWAIGSKSVGSFILENNTNSNSNSFMWEAKGYIS